MKQYNKKYLISHMEYLYFIYIYILNISYIITYNE